MLVRPAAARLVHLPGVTHAGADEEEVGTVSHPDAPDDPFPTGRPPGRFHLLHAWRLRGPGDLSRVRRELLPLASDPDPDHAAGSDEVSRRVVLVASELATNALQHGCAPTTVRLSSDRCGFLLDVADHGVATRPHVARGRAAGAGGFGLQIARRLSQDLGWYTTSTTKHVWATFSA